MESCEKWEAKIDFTCSVKTEKMADCENYWGQFIWQINVSTGLSEGTMHWFCPLASA